MDATEKGKRLGSCVFIDAFLEHHDAPDWPREHFDHFPRYRIDKENSEVLLTPFATDKMTEYAGQNGLVVSKNAMEFSTGRSLAFDQSNPRIDGTQSLNIEGDYDNPEIEISHSKSEAKILFNDAENTVQRGSVTKLNHPSRTVKIMRRGSRTIKAQKGKKMEKVVEITSGVKEIQIKPTVRIINHGVMDFFSYGGVQ